MGCDSTALSGASDTKKKTLPSSRAFTLEQMEARGEEISEGPGRWDMLIM